MYPCCACQNFSQDEMTDIICIFYECPFLIAPSVLPGQFLWIIWPVFWIVHFWLPLGYYLASFSGLFGQLLWIVHFWLPLRYYLASFSRLCIFDRPSIFSKVYIHVCIKINPCHYLRRVFILIFYARNALF